MFPYAIEIIVVHCSSMSSVTVDSIIYTLQTNGKAWVTGYDPNAFLSHVNIVASVTINSASREVISIGPNALQASRTFISITLPSTLTSIGNYALQGCTRLKSIIIPSNVTSIGEYAFMNCGFESCTFASDASSKLTSVGDHAFDSLYDVTDLIIPQGVVTIGDYAYANIFTVPHISIPTSVVSIGKNAFQSGSFFSITFDSPSKITSIADYTFDWCARLANIAIPSSVISIGKHAFSNSLKVTSVTIPPSVVSIDSMAFAQCTKLATAYIYNTTTFNSDAFTGSTDALGVPTKIIIIRAISKFTDIIYSGTTLIPQFPNSPEDATRVFATTPSPVLTVGTYTVDNVTSDNYTYALPSDATFQVTRALYPIPLALDGTSVLFDNTPHYVTVNESTPPPEAVTITYTKSAIPVSAPTAQGTYSITVTSQNYTYTTTPTQLVIRKIEYIYSIGTTSVAFTGASLPVSIVYQNTNVTGTVYYTGISVLYPYTTNPPTSKGTYLITVASSSSDYDFVAFGTRIYTITYAVATVTITSGTLVQTYTGGPISVAYIVSRPVNKTIVTYNSSPTLPVNVGTYTVSVVIDDQNIIGSESATLTIVPQIVTITLGNLTQTYSGEPKSVTYSANYPRSIIVLYNGVSDPPVDAGTYTVNAYVDQSTSLNYVGSITATLTINKAPASISLYDLSQPYKETGNTPYALTIPADLTVEYTFDGLTGNPTIVGTYNVTATINDNNYSGTVAGVFEITVGTAYIKLSNLTQAYTGASITANIMTYPYGLSTIVTYNGVSNPPINPGTYMVGAVINEHDYAGFSYDILTISKLSASVTLSSLTQTYTGTYLSTAIVTNPPNLNATFLYNNVRTPPSSVGYYNVVATIDDAFYYGTTSNTFVINKAPARITFDTQDYVYTGSRISTTATTNPEGLAITYLYNNSDTPPINAGIYDVTATINDEMYTGSMMSKLYIQKVSAPITFYSTTIAYTGVAHHAIAKTSPANLPINYTYYKYNTSTIIPTPSNAGTYTAKASVISDSNYGGSAYSKFTIEKAMGAVVFSSNAFRIPYSTAVNIVGTTTPYLNLNVTYTYSSINYYSSAAPSEVGTYTVLGEITGETNWTGYGSTSLTIVKGNGVIQFPKASVSYTGEPLPISTIITFGTLKGPDLAVNASILYNGYSSPPTNIGTYRVEATIDDNRWQGTSTLSNYSIVRGSPSIQILSTIATYSIPYSLSTVISPNTLTPIYIYSNATYYSETPPTRIGTYTVSATVDTELYYGFSTGQLVIKPYMEPVYIAGRTQIYTGKPVTPRAVTDIPNILTHYTYASTSIVIQQPSTIGDYTVSATLIDDNYKGWNSNVPFSVVLGPPTSLSAYPVDKGAILVWLPPTAPPSGTLEYIVHTIPPVVPPFTTTGTFVRISTLTNSAPYRFTVTPSHTTGMGLPYQAYIAPFAGTGTPGYLDNEEPLAAMNAPADIAFDSERNLYVADTLNGVIRKIDKNGTVTTIPFDCGEPRGIAIDGANLYVSDARNHVLYKITLQDPPTKTLFAGVFGQSGIENGLNARFNAPKGLVLYNRTSLYVADSGNHTIRSVDLESHYVTTVAGTGVAGYIDAQGLNAAFDAPSGVAVDSRGNIYVADTGNHMLRKIDATALRNVTTIVGSIEGFRDGANALFSGPSRLAIDAHDNLFVSDTGNNVIRKVSATDQRVTTLVGYIKAGMTQGLGTYATLRQPQGLAWDEDMNLYVADSSNHAIRKITLTPIATTTPAPGVLYNPLPPYNLSAINNTDNVVLSWTPAQQPVLPLSAYRIAYGDISIQVNSSETSATLTGLRAGQTYTISIYAANAFGESVAASITTTTISTNIVFQIENTTQYYTGDQLDARITTIPPALEYTVSYTSAPIAIGEHIGTVTVDTGRYVGSATFVLVILDPKPGPVQGPMAVAGDGSATVRWTAPINTGQGPIVKYTITPIPADAPSITTPNDTLRSVTIGGLRNGSTYRFSVLAYNSFGESVPALTDVVIPKGAPSAPRSVLATTNPSGSVTVQWDPPFSDGGYPITSYVVQPSSEAKPIAVQGTSHTFTTGLRGGYSYVFEVQATNAFGTGPASIASNRAIPLTPPEPPTVSAIRGYKKATVSWNIPNSGGRPITSFVIQTSPATLVYTTPEGATTQYEIYDLDDSVAYSFAVYGRNDVGNGESGITPFLVGKSVAPKRGNRPSWFA